MLIEPGKKIISSKGEINKISNLLEQSLKDFNIYAKIIGVKKGPVITRYIIDLQKGTKISKIINISQDLARSISTTSIKIINTIPNEPYIAIEIPNKIKKIIHIKEVIGSSKFIKFKYGIIIAIGLNIYGEPILLELTKMPHILIAGTTGSGKSTGINAIIISILYKYNPEEIKFIMIDPKILDLSIYKGIPHLLTSVITDMKKAIKYLNWCIKEMNYRYELMSLIGVKNIVLLNSKIEKADKLGKPLKDVIFIKNNPKKIHKAPFLKKIPYIIIIIDEFADMIMILGKEIEKLIIKIAQKSRAAGIHIILATQRPSINIVTGLIKANIPTRIAYKVSSKIDSRIIIDQNGAEQLLGNGDMLYLGPENELIRIHGAFVDDNEIYKVVEHWKKYKIL